MTKLSILIPSTPERKQQTEILTTYIKSIRESLNAQKEIEIKVFEDDKTMTIGEKRKQMYEAAKGVYSWQIDSDDWISPRGISLILNAIAYESDCITFKELIIWEGKRIEQSNFSLQYTDWQNNFDGYNYVRTPFFKTPIKTEICKLHCCEDIRFGEDHAFSRSIKPHLKTETHIDEFIYYYLHYSSPHNERYGITQ